MRCATDQLWIFRAGGTRTTTSPSSIISIILYGCWLWSTLCVGSMCIFCLVRTFLCWQNNHQCITRVSSTDGTKDVYDGISLLQVPRVCVGFRYCEILRMSSPKTPTVSCIQKEFKFCRSVVRGSPSMPLYFPIHPLFACKIWFVVNAGWSPTWYRRITIHVEF